MKSVKVLKSIFSWVKSHGWLLAGICFGVSSVFFCIYAIVTKDYDVLCGVPLQTSAGLSLIIREL